MVKNIKRMFIPLYFLFSSVNVYAYNSAYNETFSNFIGLLKMVTKFTMESLIVISAFYIVYISFFDPVKRGINKVKYEREDMITQVFIYPFFSGMLGLLILTFIYTQLQHFGIPVYDIIKDWIKPLR